MEELKIGSVVQLKSGGPEMTILRFVGTENSNLGQKAADEIVKIKGHKDGDVVCQWFNGNEVKDGIFSRESLKKVRD
jgi:uncharacterized protein YodC (DUF2158 family)